MSKKHKAPPKPPPTMTPRERIIAEAIEDAMRPYLGVLPPEGLATMRSILEETMATHPVVLDALAEMEGAPPRDRSGTRVKDGEGADDGGEKGGEGGAS
jgi:hypothetical protein